MAAGTDAPPIGLIISMEGADPILTPDDLDEWWDAGLRILSLSHFGNGRYSHGTGTPGPLNPQGPALLAAMERLGMILDLTHLADEAMDQAFDRSAARSWPVTTTAGPSSTASGSSATPTSAGSPSGAASSARRWTPGCSTSQAGQGGQGPGTTATLATVADHIDHVCQVAGSARHAALGTDLDGGFGTEQSPTDLDTIADLAVIPAILRRRGYSEPDIEGIMHGNWLALMRRAWTTR